MKLLKNNKTTYINPQDIGLNTVIYQNIWKLVPDVCYMDLVDNETTIEDATTYKIELDKTFDSLWFSKIWITDMLERWKFFRDVTDIINSDKTQDEKFSLIKTCKDLHDREIMKLRPSG